MLSIEESVLQLKLNGKESLFIFIKYMKILMKKNQWNCRWDKNE